MIKEIIYKLISKQSLTFKESFDCMHSLLRGDMTEVQIGAFLYGLSVKGEVKEEIMGALKAVYEHMVPIDGTSNVVDTCGTGGDMIDSFNTSTAAALIASAAGVDIAKCGNRASSSSCGSADLLEEIGIKIDLSPSEAREWLKESGFSFLFTPKFHPLLNKLSPLRKQLGIPTILNRIGPLGNPVRPRRRLLGVSNRKLAPLYSELLLELGTDHSLVVHGLDGMDEISISAPTDIYMIRGGKIDSMRFDPRSLGIDYVPHKDIRGGDTKQNRDTLFNLFEGEKGAIRNIACINAGATIMLGGKAKDLKEGMLIAEQTIDSGLAKSKLRELINRGKEKGVDINHVHAR
ncbi:anthranilate phosphoribosyltransferase [Priestia aryabhattai]|uniref:anthranilate phosphoribosyltransferase n=1 Tax=Priestia megaterium TaxID=1404 RepID=UPI0039B8E76A